MVWIFDKIQDTCSLLILKKLKIYVIEAYWEFYHLVYHFFERDQFENNKTQFTLCYDYRQPGNVKFNFTALKTCETFGCQKN